MGHWGSITSLFGICAANRIHNVCQLPLGVSIASTITALRYRKSVSEITCYLLVLAACQTAYLLRLARLDSLASLASGKCS